MPFVYSFKLCNNLRNFFLKRQFFKRKILYIYVRQREIKNKKKEFERHELNFLKTSFILSLLISSCLFNVAILRQLFFMIKCVHDKDGCN